MITSVRNARVKWVRRLQARPKARQEEQAFVLEGVRLIEEALAAGWPARLVMYTRDLTARGQALVDRFAGQAVETVQVTSGVMQAASDTQAPQGVLVVLEAQDLPLPQKPDLVLIADGVRDPGNLGTLLRTASAAGVQAFLLAPGTVDPYAPKVLRAGMGAHFRVPIGRLEWEAIEAYLWAQTDSPLQVILAAAGANVPYTQVDMQGPVALIVGGEAAGAGTYARRLAHTSVQIPMPGGGESLNVAAAAAIILYEVVRQRSAAHPPRG